MEKVFNWHEPGREKVSLSLIVDNGNVVKASMKCVGGLDFLKLSQEMKKKLIGPLADLLPPSGSDYPSMIWREIIGQIQNEWQLPFTHEEICHCRKVSTQKVDRAIVYGAHTVDEVRKRTSANTGCGTCKNDVAQMISYRLKV